MSLFLKKAVLRPYHFGARYILPLLPFSEPELICGAGEVSRLPELVRSAGMKHVFIVSDQGLVAAGLVDRVTQALADQQIPFTLFDQVEPNPSIENIEEGYRQYKEAGCDGMIALGGGSPMDCAKIVGARVVKPKKPVRKMRGKFRILKKLPPFIAIPTTAGTGSETTPFAVISDRQAHEKFSIADLFLTPQIAVLDPELMVGLPPHITAATGMDALTHAVEAYISFQSSPYSEGQSEKAVKLVFENLVAVYRDGSDLKKREQMALASFYAGIAFTRAVVGYVHAIAHNMGGLYGVPHGLANAIILPHVLRASLPHAEKKLAKLAVISGLGSEDENRSQLAYKTIEKIEEMNRAMEIPTSIAELKAADIPLVVKRALSEASLDYAVPRIMSRAELTKLVESLLPERND